MANTFDSNREKHLARLKRMRLMDDTLMSVVFRSKECTQLLLQIVLENDSLVVTEVTAQHTMPNLHGRSVRFDVTAHDRDGRMYNIEVQRADKGAVPKRARYNSGMMDSNITVAGEAYDDLPESYVIFITENDVFAAGHALYHIERIIQETNTLFDDKAHIIYVNGAYRGNDSVGKLMHDFRCLSVDEMNYPLLADETRRYKELPEGVNIMCKIMEDLAIESHAAGLAAGHAAGLAEGLAEGQTEGKVAAIVTYMKRLGASVDEALEFFSIPAEEQENYRRMIEAALRGE